MTISPQDLVNREVHYCVSGLVSTLASNAYDGSYSTGAGASKELVGLCEQACDLAAPIDDWEEAAIQAGWKPNPNGNTNWVWKDDLGEIAAESWQNACEQDDLEPYQREVFEHWLVSDWLADKLEALGEKVDRDFAGLAIWARTTTGQAISADGVIERICADLNTVEVA